MARKIVLAAVLVLALACVASARRPPRRPPVAAQVPFAIFPHNCFPGNELYNGQAGAIDCTPYQVNFVSATKDTVKYSVVTKAASTRCAAAAECRTMALGDVKFNINPTCVRPVNGFTVTDSKSTYTRASVYAKEEYPNGDKARSLRLVFPKPYTAQNVTGLTFTINLSTKDGACNAAQLFNVGHGVTPSQAQYAYYGFPNKKCCGTSVTTFA